jgi:hypothetical protein
VILQLALALLGRVIRRSVEETTIEFLYLLTIAVVLQSNYLFLTEKA